MIKLFLFDIEGTTTDIQFVHKILFPYSKEKIKETLLGGSQKPEIIKIIDGVKGVALKETGKTIDLVGVIELLQKWIVEDRKEGHLKLLQGIIWDAGYRNGDFKGHLYPDVAPFFSKIHKQGRKIAIYSSGSTQAQKLIMGFSLAGDLTPFISYYFDTQVGGKREAKSYEKIAKETGLHASEICFFSDIKEELEAAKMSGLKVVQVFRNEKLVSQFDSIINFDEFIEPS